MSTGEAGALASLLKGRGLAATAPDESTVKVAVASRDGEFDVESGELLVRTIVDGVGFGPERRVVIWGGLAATADHIAKEMI